MPSSFFCFVFKLSNLEVWFQRPKDIVRKIKSGDLDLGVVGYDIVCECGEVIIIYLPYPEVLSVPFVHECPDALFREFSLLVVIFRRVYL